MKKLIGRIEPVLHLQGYLNTVPGGVYAPEDETIVSYIVRDKTGEEVPAELVEEESTAATKIIQLLVAIGGSTTDEELAEIEAEIDRLLNETDPVELGNLAGHSIVNKIRLAQVYRDDIIAAIEEKGISAADEQPFRTVADLVKQIIRQAKTVTPTTEEQIIVPDEGVYGLESVTVEGVQLQEINVWSTDTEQVITPDEGYMGFSKVTVDAVESSGGWGDDYGGAVEDTTWGDEYTDTDVPTGNLDYSGGADENPSYIPEIPGEGDYKVLFKNGMKEGTLFRYTVNSTTGGRETKEIKSSFGDPIFVYNAYGTYDSEHLMPNGQLHPTIIDYIWVYHPEKSVSYKVRTLPNTEWSEPRESMSYYSDARGCFAKCGGVIGGGNIITGEVGKGLQCEGLPKYNVGHFATSSEVYTAMRIAGTSHAVVSDTEQYVAFVSKTPIYYDGSSITNADGSPMSIYNVDAADGNEWVYTGATDGTSVPVGGYDLTWNSHDLKDMNGEDVTAEKSDDPIPEMTSTGEPTLTPVEREGTYSVDGDTMNGLVGAAQKVTGSTTPLSPTEATAALDDYMANPAEEMKW